jgi:elongation factor P
MAGEHVSTNQFRNGMHIALDGEVWRIVEFQHVKPGKGGAFVRTKLKSVDAGDEVVFMDAETYDQIQLPRRSVEDELQFLAPSSTVQMLTIDGRPGGIQMPASLELAVAETEPGVKGDTVSNVTKPARLETGAVVQVPLFVNAGDRIRVDPREKRYISRA